MSKGTRTKQRIVDAALAVAEREGYALVTRDLVALEAACATGLVNKHYSNMVRLRGHLIQRAVERRSLRVLGEALAARHPAALALPLTFRQQAAAALANA